MKQLVIKQEYIYKVGNIEYFTFYSSYYNRYYRDNNVIISKNDKYILEKIANECELDYKGLKKKQLIELIENSDCLVLGD